MNKRTLTRLILVAAGVAALEGLFMPAPDQSIARKVFSGGLQGITAQVAFIGLAEMVVALIVAYIGLNLRTYATFLRNLLNSKGMLLNLSFNDFKKKYVTSYLGSMWSFIMPLIQIVTYWFVFQVGFKSGNVGDCPYILWLIAGIVPWFFIAESLAAGTTVYSEYSFLVKKIVFRIELLPMVKVMSAFFNHLFFITIAFLAFVLSGYGISIHAVQVIYYGFCLFTLLFALSLLGSTLNVFIRDIGQVVAVIIQIGFWFTPIGWVFQNTIRGPLALVFKLNPFFYIVEGYRNAFVYRQWFWESPLLTAYFWTFTLFTFLVSIKSYNRLKPHFADLI